MTECNESVANRRELRRKRILENAELRKQKIFGLSKNVPSKVNNAVNKKDDTPSLSQKHEELKISDDKDETGSTKSIESEVSNKSHSNDSSSSISDITRINEVLRNIPDPITEYENENDINSNLRPVDEGRISSLDNNSGTLPMNLRKNPTELMDSSSYISNFHNNSGNNLRLNSNENFPSITPCFLIYLLEHPASPCLLALMVSLLLSLNLGNLVSHSITIPFFIWEIQQIIASYSVVEKKEPNASILEAALLLCGVRKSLFTKYIWISKLLRDILEDFSIYMATVCIWGAVIGYPSVTRVS